uniref:ADP-ribosylation factor-like 14 n=1 Tax=Astyanax mexicanus TaxID=7994 RepID=A0A3B1JTT9_ASTMX
LEFFVIHQMRAYWKHYYQDSSGLVYVVDSHDQNRLSEAKQELEQILEHEELESKPLIVLANKQDLPGAANADDIAETLNLKEICGNRNWLIQPCSGRTGEVPSRESLASYFVLSWLAS